MARLSSRHRNVSRVLLGAHIKQARKEAGLSQTEVGKLLSKVLRRPEIFSQAAISDFERGVTIFPEQDLPVLAQVLGKPVEYFTNLPDDKLREKGQKLFDIFKRAHGLPADWPTLRLLPDEELYTAKRFYNRGEYDSRFAGQIEVILDQARRPSQMVLTAPGHGCSTLSRWITERLINKARRWGIIPALLALEDFPAEDARHSLIEEIQRQIALIPDAHVVLVIDYSSPLVRENFNRYLIALGQFREAVAAVESSLGFTKVSHMNFGNTRVADIITSFEKSLGEVVTTSISKFNEYEIFTLLALHTFGGPWYRARAALDSILKQSMLNGLVDLPVADAMEELKNRLILAAGS